MTMDENENPEGWKADTSPLQLLARIDERSRDMQAWMEKIELKVGAVETKLGDFIKEHNRTCPVRVHAAYFKLIACALGLLGAGIVGLALKAIAS